MPAYVGGENPGAGIKWIASFPDNIQKGLQRAHAVIILNDVNSGKPLCTINSGLISAMRTAAVTGLVIDQYLAVKPSGNKLTAGIIGFGPIGRTHLQMLESMFGEQIEQYLLYDMMPGKTADLPGNLSHKIKVLESWRAVYEQSDVFVTCTVARERYINTPPKKGSLQLNISLRDYMPECRKYVDVIIVDDWDEVCRENTDIELMHKQYGLQPGETITLGDVVVNKKLKGLLADQVVMFNPMGMAVFDIAVANYFYQLALSNEVGVLLED
jgi:ornithine cyclodeaminase